ncbi:LOW QUALITY PROTEIN: testis-specific protein 10-interacting protein [Acomys russatus]|uniref:LOW QUALITY PROTEIN: testis-specific protein 10-interacting protein n=1 Tax=Acomys russatus TaxID=60746 RepID=UPI0021E209C8|nr:LOW QUALITY PROTEIN: testis-specific protein 10-interacting protein [Acomys russatus]
MLNTTQLLAKGFSERPRQSTESLVPRTATGLLKLLSSISAEEQRSLGSGDSLQNHSCQLQRSQSAGQTAKKERKPRRRNRKGHCSAEAEDLFTAPSRKPSFPFQWAWESFIVDGQALFQPSSSVAPGHRRSLLLPPAAVQLRSRRKSMANLSEDPGAGQKMEIQNPGRINQPGRYGTTGPTPGKAESLGLEPSSQGSVWPPGKGSGSESEDVSEVEGRDAEEAERVLSSGELPQILGQGLILEEELISEMMEEEEQSAPHKRKGSSGKKGRNSSEMASEKGELKGHSQGSSPSSNSLRKAQKGVLRAKELQGPWDLERLHRQLQEELDCGPQEQSWKALRAAVQARNRKAPTLGGDESFLSAGFSNRTFHKRQEANRNLMQSLERQQLKEKQQAEVRRARERQVQQQVARCLAAYSPKGRRGALAAQHKLEELRSKDRQRFVEYQAELQGIQHRVQARPFLFQQAMQTNARLTANRRFSQVLSALGVDEEQLLADAGNTEGIPQNTGESLGVEMEPSSQSPPKTEPPSSQPGRQPSPSLDPEHNPNKN